MAYLAVTSWSTVALSADGVSWTSATLPSGRVAVMAQFGSGRVAVFSADGWVCHSDDGGATWSSWRFIASMIPRGTCFIAGKWVVMNRGSGAAWWSTDTISWTAFTAPYVWGYRRHATVHGGVAVMAGDSYLIASSTDGLTWTTHSTTGLGRQMHAGIWTGTQFVAVDGTVSGFRHATVAAAWTASTMGALGCSRVATNGTVVVAATVVAGSLRYSTDDGATWSASSSPSLTGGYVLWDGLRFVAVGTGAGQRALTSTDGINWTAGDVLSATWVTAGTWTPPTTRAYRHLGLVRGARGVG